MVKVIEVSKTQIRYRVCNCCNSNENVVEILFRHAVIRQGTEVALCEKCARNLTAILNQMYTEVHDTNGGNTKKEQINDAVSRQALIDVFYKYPNVRWTTLDVLKKINSIPTVQPKT